METALDVKKHMKVAAIWVLLLLGIAGTFTLTKKIENGGAGNAAAAFGVGGSLRTFYLYEGKVEPLSITARPGDEILFMVLDESRHNIAEERTSDRGPRLESGEFGAGESYSLSFGSPGMYSFYDRMNRDIQATIIIRK